MVCRRAAPAKPMSDALPAAPLWRRLLAFVYDLLLLLGLWFFVALVAVAINQGPVGAAIENGAVRVQDWPAQLALYTALWLVTGIYYTLSWRHGGQTLGMKPWRLRVDALPRGALDTGRAWRRYLAACLTVLTAGAGLLWCLVDRDRRALHDHLAGTRVALLPKGAIGR
jgi:uncharacterized RDD family membrane protein YckC